MTGEPWFCDLVLLIGLYCAIPVVKFPWFFLYAVRAARAELFLRKKPTHRCHLAAMLFVTAMLLSMGAARHGVAESTDSVPKAMKPRIVVMTDIGGDPDDRQSLVRFLLYSCEFDVEGLCTGFGHGHYENTRPDLIREAVEAYGKVLPNLRRHRRDYPSAAHLAGLIKDGSNGDPHSVGPGRDSEASDWIIRVIDRDDPRPVWLAIWGGPRELAQAIWKVSQTRSAEDLAKFKRKIRVHSIADQDRTAEWIKKNHPDVFWIYSARLFRAIWQHGDQALVSPQWLRQNVLKDHGPLGTVYPPKAAGKDGVKEGDTPSFLYILPNGLSDPEHPEWGNWGGRFRSRGSGNEFVPAPDIREGKRDLFYSIHRWRQDFQNEFAARMDWCVLPFAESNHAPSAVCNGDKTLNVLDIDTTPGANVSLDASGSTDPDGDRLRFRWWVYREAGSYWGDCRFQHPDRRRALLTVPADAAGRTIHVILEVKDTGSPPLVAYRRVVLKVAGQPVEPPADVLHGLGLRKKPIKHLSGPAKRSGPWTFFRGININGPPVTIDGHRWDGDDAANFVCEHKPLQSPTITLIPPTNESRATMIHSFRWDRQFKLELLRVPPGTFAVYAYVWEETDPETIQIRLNGKIVERDLYTGVAGCWQRLGPWFTDIKEGKIVIESAGGAANFSGVEVWKKPADRGEAP